MNKFFLASFLCLLCVFSFGQAKSEETVVYNLGTMVMFEEWTTDHVILPVKKTDVEKRGLKGPVTYFNHEILNCSIGEYGFSKREVFKETIEFDFSGKQLNGQRVFDQREHQNLEYELDNNGFIKKAKVSDVFSRKSLGTEYYKYDALGNVTAARMEDTNGSLESITSKFYNEHDELIEEKRKKNDEVVFWEKYDRSAGKMNIHDLLNGDIWIGDLNEKGDVIRLFNNENNQTQEVIYKYDSWGNWTYRTKTSNGEQIEEVFRSFHYETLAERLAVQTPVPVRVGKQFWMNENLNVKKFNNGDAIAQAQSSTAWEISLQNGTPAWCYCEDLAGNLTNEVLYNYFAISDPRGLAPTGYRIATLEDWNILFNKYGGLEKAFEKLKDKKRNVLNTAGMHGYRHGTSLLMESSWWTKDEKKIFLAVDDIGTMLIFENEGNQSYYDDGLLLRCVKE